MTLNHPLVITLLLYLEVWNPIKVVVAAILRLHQPVLFARLVWER